jgi:hypothetical protein
MFVAPKNLCKTDMWFLNLWTRYIINFTSSIKFKLLLPMDYDNENLNHGKMVKSLLKQIEATLSSNNLQF